MFRTFRLLISKVFFPAGNADGPEVSVRLSEIEATQARILQLLEELAQDEVPRNADRIYKISQSRNVLFLNDLLPQIYLTLVSVLQGAVLAILIDEFTFDFWYSNPAIYAYFVSSLLMVLAFWHSYLSAILDGRWPFRFADTALFFMAATAQAIAVRNVTVPVRWCQSVMVMCLIAAITYLRQVSLLRQLKILDLFEDPDEVVLRTRAVCVMAVFFVIGAGVALLFIPILSSNPQSLTGASLAIAAPIFYIIYSIYNTARSGIDVV